jgi:hypothetical protein
VISIARAIGSGPFCADDVPERFTLDELHRDVQETVANLAVVEHARDVLVLDLARVHRFAAEARGRTFASRTTARDEEP